MPSAVKREGLRISIDRGGTFTDCVCKVPHCEDIVVKILSVDPSNYDDAPTEAVRKVLEIHTGRPVPRRAPIDLSCIESIRMGTTVCTNSLLERKGKRTALLITKGFKDLLTIGNQSRPAMFDLQINRPSSLFCLVEEVSERVVVDTCPDSQLRGRELPFPESLEIVETASGEKVRILEELNATEIKHTLLGIREQGITSLAVCLMHSYMFPDHERQIRDVASDLGFEQVCLSSEVSNRPKAVPRGNSTVLDAYLTPVINDYLSRFAAGFPDIDTSGTKLQFMQSDGGLVPSTSLSGLRSILSGPAGGVVGYARTCYDETDGTPVIGFDMGGTSTDVSRYAGQLEHIFEANTAGIVIQAPQLDINTIAAGGGSCLVWRDGLMNVGPESASSHPGPACYRKGGPLTITDANLALGRLIPERFPSVFGPTEDQPLDTEIVERKFKELTAEINAETGQSLSWRQVAAGFVDVANNAMCGPIRSLTEARGHDASKHNLSSFGGAGGQHFCDIAQILGIKRVLVHKYSSILSAHGIGLADVVEDSSESYLKKYEQSQQEQVDADLAKLEEKTQQSLLKGGFRGQVESSRYLSLRYDGSDTSLMVLVETGQSPLDAFVEAHHQEFGFTPVGRDVYIDELRVRSVAKVDAEKTESWPSELAKLGKPSAPSHATFTRPVFFPELQGLVDTPVYALDGLARGTKVNGPCLIVDDTQTLLINPHCSATILSEIIVVDVAAAQKPAASSTAIDPVKLSVFRHRFYGVAEQMCRTLQKTSISANIRERLDFSCSVFEKNGDLAAVAPNVPAMLGSMAFAVRSQIKHWQGKLQDGDVLLSNSPKFGGVHLPDMTVITPVFDESGKDIVYWVASRGHHADVGGIAPGSMPPSSTELWEEGAVFDSFLMVRGGKLDEEGLARHLLEEPAKLPGCSGTRCYQDNLTDLKAQIASNFTGIRLIRQMIAEYSMEIVQVYMSAIQGSSELAVRNLFKRLANGEKKRTISATDYMDDGTPICLSVEMNGEDGSARFNFDGTGPEVLGNWNAPIAITSSAIIFSLRCMVGDIPFNGGCLRAVDIAIPDDCFLNPSDNCGVCAGNVLTSQRIVDVIFRAFETCAASQGCMNNFTFGVDGEGGFGYYETICGGSGAGPTWNGTSGVHTNMTNTRITDPETLERRYPVILKEFSLRPGSGGRGEYNGGDGIIRDVQFRIPMTASILSERRSFQPYGLHGGEGGKRGENLWLRTDGRRINVGGKKSAKVGAGDRFVIQTPGGGAYGPSQETKDAAKSALANGSAQGKAHIPLAGGTVDMLRTLGEQV